MSFLYSKDVNISEPLNMFSELQTASRSPVFEIIPIKGITSLRDISNTSGSATITSNGTEIQVQTGATSGSTAELYTGPRGRYLAGLGGEAGMGVRFPNTDPQFFGTATAVWGYTNRENGIEFGRDINGIFIRVMRNNTVIHKKYQTEWNLDKLDGTGPSGVTLDINNGNIFQIEFTWYGYGDIIWNVVDHHVVDNTQRKIPIHYFRPTQQTSIQIPNLPVTAYIENGDQSWDYRMYIGGRQFSVIGPFNPLRRLVSQYVFNAATDTTLSPYITIKSKETSADLGVNKKLDGWDIFATTENHYIQVRLGATVANTAAFRVPDDHSNNEVSMLVDTTATSWSGGEPIYGGLVGVSGSSQGPSDPSGDGKSDGLFLDIPGNKTISLGARTVSGTGSLTMVLRWREEF